jgi:hypothetical protein
MRANLLTACGLSLIVSGCIWGDRDFSLSSVRLVEFPDQPSPLELQFKVEFTTRANLSVIMAEGYPLRSNGYFCDRPSDFAILLLGRLYFRDQALGGEVGMIPQTGPFTYATYMGVARDAFVPSKPPQVGYDLRRNAEDVCFYVAGGIAPAPIGYKSNTVRIPTNVIEAALQNASIGSN